MLALIFASSEISNPGLLPIIFHFNSSNLIVFPFLDYHCSSVRLHLEGPDEYILYVLDRYFIETIR